MTETFCNPSRNESYLNYIPPTLTIGCGVVMFVVTIIVTIAFRKYTWMNTTYNRTVLLLLWSDSMSSFIVSTIRVIFEICGAFTILNCTVIMIFTRFFGYISLSALCYLSLERYLKIVKPYYHQIYMDKNKNLGAIISIIFGSFCVCICIDLDVFHLLRKGSEQADHCTYSVAFQPITGLMTTVASQFIAIIIFIISDGLLIKYIREFQRQFDEQVLNVNLEETKASKRLKRKRIDIQIAKCSVLISLLYIAFVIPIQIIDIIQFSKKLSGEEEISKAMMAAINVCVYLVIVYPALEAIAFLLSNAQFRRVLMIMMGRRDTSILNRYQEYSSNYVVGEN